MNILNAATEPDFRRWVDLWLRWPGREVTAHPAYVRLFTRPLDLAVCAVSDSGAGGILFPAILRPISSEPWSEECEESWDLVTPYGYGGPFAWDTDSAMVDRYWKAFSAWTKEQKVVTTFTRLSLFPEQVLDIPALTAVDRQNVVRTLQLNSETMWMDYAHKVRKNVNRARQQGVEVRIDERGDELDAFLQIYEATLDRRDADSGYYFRRDFFQAIIRDLAGQFAFFHAVAQGQIVSTELVLVSAHHIYSFLGGTLADFFPIRPNDLLKHTIIEWGRDKGKSAFVLGGGWQSGDGIFNYKLAFAPTGAVDFRVAKWVHDSGAYERLLARRREWESARGNVWIPRQGFFPEYRG